MHVTLVTGIDPGGARAGGTRSYVLGLAERLRDRTVGVSLVARGNGASPLPGIDYLRIRSGPSSPRFLMRLWAAAPLLPIPADSIIHAQRPDDLSAFTLAKRRNPKVCTLHGIPALGVRRRKGTGLVALYSALEPMGLRRANRVIAVDEATARWYAGRYPWVKDRTEVVPTAVDTRRFRPMDRSAARSRFGVRADRVALYAGRLSPEKRVDGIVAAMPKVPRAELLIAGEGPEEIRLRRSAGPSVRFLGPVSHDQMPSLLNAADVLVLVSEYEGLPTIALEALACGVPVIATPVGGIPDLVVPGSTGWLIPDASRLAAVLADALPKSRDMRDACVAAARPYSWDAVVDRILAVYRQAEARA